MRGFVILDFGSQYTQLIARRLRELGHYSEILPPLTAVAELQKKNPYGLILSGGPNSVYEEASPRRSVRELAEIAPILGVCYGMQLIAHELGGHVKKGTSREYGPETVEWLDPVVGVPQTQNVWMSHGDVVEALPAGFRLWGKSSTHIAAMQSERIWGLQFHPEVAHTEHGEKILQAFAKFCGAPADWQTSAVVNELLHKVKTQVGPEQKVLCALSGGVDSSVAAMLVTRALGADRVQCLFVNNGLLRKNEFEEVLKNYQNLGLQVEGVRAENEFLRELKEVSDPEQKRKIIGRVFIETFEKWVEKTGGFDFLVQGTLYPDVIESVSVVGGSHTIKTHHNVGGLPERMKFKLLEPFRFLFKDEVRRVGLELGLPENLIWRHPFPGPGLGIRILGEVSEDRLELLREADEIYVNYLKEKDLYNKIWQAFCVLLPVKSVGVQGDARTYDATLAIRAVTSTDGMTADWYAFSAQDLREISRRITNKVRGINRVVYDVTCKPPATIEWE